jgi:nickel-dependent lactate racemase
MTAKDRSILAKFDLAFGNSQQEIEIGESHVLATLRTKTIPPPSTSLPAVLLSALDNPFGSESFDKIFGDAQNVVIVVPDKTRNCGASLFLPILLQRLSNLGVSDNGIKIILATGTHVGHTAEQRVKIVGADLAHRVTIVDHNCHDDAALVYLDETKYGTPVAINRLVVDADRVLVVGTAAHHYFAGFGGGPKMINPGCAGYETISKNHARTIDERTGRLHSGCRAGEMETNPVQMDIADSLRFIRADFLFETVLSDSGNIVAAFAGDLIAAHRHACQLIDKHFKVPISEKADLVVVSCGGYPKDINFIQAHKSLHNAFYAVKDGGVILALAECREGIGSQTFLEWFEYESDNEFRDNLRRKYKVNGTTALALKMKTRSTYIIFVSSLPPDLVRKLGMIPMATASEGWEMAQSRLPSGFKTYVIPNGSLTLPEMN